MKVILFSSKPYDKKYFEKTNKHYGLKIEYWETHLGPHIVDAIGNDVFAVCVFVNDKVTASVIETLALKGVKLIALRCAGFNNVDLNAAKEKGLRVCRVPAYSPEAVAEHTAALLLTLNRKTHKAYNRVREQNFSLNGLIGFNMLGKTVGIVGTGKIGAAFCKIMLGFGCKVIAYDPYKNENLEKSGITYHSFEEVLKQADILSMHCPLSSSNFHIINKDTLAIMKQGVTILNTSRGGLINTRDVIAALKKGKIAHLGIDVYEQEEKLFFKDLSGSIIEDDMIQRLISFPNVLITGHQAFLTHEALEQIANTTLKSIVSFSNNENIKEAPFVLV